jgi:PPM family protein phosphatase
VDVAILVVPAARSGDDRAGAFIRPEGYVLVLADGAGGTFGGAAAADPVLDSAPAFSSGSVADCARFLENLDRRLENVGQTTAVVAVVSGGTVYGASVGDSGAWLIDAGGITDFTEHQEPKPVLGSGNARPIGFGPIPCVGRIVMATDGLFKYVPHESIRDIVSGLPLADSPAALVAAARLSSGTLQDDIAIIVAEPKGIGGLITAPIP